MPSVVPPFEARLYDSKDHLVVIVLRHGAFFVLDIHIKRLRWGTRPGHDGHTEGK